MKKFLLAAFVLGAIFSYSFADHTPEAVSKSEQILLASRGAGG
ncbi:hypothetical protein OZL92_23540 [Bacillus sonorensis]|uniref:Uncharacterized protein n=2 Tax=Bacillus sonorensis TaxID=119858 RepID=M5NW41_9BACI|nr:MULTISPECIES: hypothetical protein [Bacillus]TWK85428.1 hypothetical protein CHCC20335_2387 [Bacillus paralicheniformis]ASB87766.1 hypothetical protein S101395_01230 [Bacillus sonorensis]EME72141.1 hypothetical protein BSONL12_23665 [Bacillus sonorensis L12]MCZ0075669.1 hypothetical protein [Bacillus sonorensis]MCZ0094291.1 hypothetical protein [Bacillus sonorensis]